MSSGNEKIIDQFEMGQVIASCALEGLPATPEEQTLLDDLASGKITPEQLEAEIVRKYSQNSQG